MSTITNNQKTLIGVSTALLLYLFLKPKVENGGGTTDPTGNGTNDPTDTSAFDPKKVAADLYEAMKNSGTNSSLITTTLGSISQAQFGEVVKAFGSRYYNSTLGNTIEFIWQTLPKYDLKKWFFYELSDKEYNFWKLKYPKYL